MMKKLLAVAICIALMLTPGFAEEVSVPGVRVTLDQLSVTIGEETFAPDLALCLDGGQTEHGGLLGFHVDLGGNRLLPVQAKMVEEGLALSLGNSSVYCFSPEMLGMEEMVETSEKLPTVSELAYDFVEYLDAYEEDSFELEPLELMAWLEGELYLEAGALRQWTSDDALPLVTAERDTLGYTIIVGGEDPLYITLRASEQRVSFNSYGNALIIGADNSIQFSETSGINYEGYLNQSTLVTFKYLPQADGGSSYSFNFKIHEYYYEESYRALSGDLQFNVTGGSDAEGVHDAKVSYIEEYDGVTDLKASLHVSVVPAQVEDRLAGQTPIMIESETDSGMNSLSFAAMGLFSDVERLLNDAAVSGMIDAYNAQCDEYNEIYMQDYAEYYAVDFEVPEFGWTPDGVALAGVDVNEAGVQFEYDAGESGKLYIEMKELDEQPQSGEEEAPALAYAAGENSFEASIIENGVETRIYSDDFALTEAEVQQMLDGRIWAGEGYDDGTNMYM